MEKDDEPYEVGYCKPPREHQFPPKTSGNPSGRPPKGIPGPKRSFNPFVEIFATEMERIVRLREGGEPVDLSAFAAVVRSTAACAIKGKGASQKLVFETNYRVQEQRLRDIEKYLNIIERYKAEWPEKARAASRAGKKPPVPHPAHIDFSLETGFCQNTGPLDEKGAAAWDELKALIRRELESLAFFESLDATDDARDKGLRLCKRNLRSLKRVVPKGWNWREQLEYPSL